MFVTELTKTENMAFPAGTSSKADCARSKAPLQNRRHALAFFTKIQVKVSRGWCMFGGCLQEDAETCASDLPRMLGYL